MFLKKGGGNPKKNLCNFFCNYILCLKLRRKRFIQGWLETSNCCCFLSFSDLVLLHSIWSYLVVFRELKSAVFSLKLFLALFWEGKIFLFYTNQFCDSVYPQVTPKVNLFILRKKYSQTFLLIWNLQKVGIKIWPFFCVFNLNLFFGS